MDGPSGEIPSVVTPEMHAAVGSVLTAVVSHPVGASDIRRWIIATHWPDPPPAGVLEADARELVAPEDFNPFAWAARSRRPESADRIAFDDPARFEKLAGIPGPGLRYNLHGGIAVSYGARMRVGDVITGETVLAGYREADGRLGRMLITTTEETWTNQTGERVKTCRLDLIRY